MSQVFSGPKASLKLNGVKVAFVGSVSINQINDLTGIDILDQLEKAEWAETGHDCSFSCTLFKVDQNAAQLLGLDPQNLDDILTQGELVMEIFDRIENKVQYTMTGVKWAGGSGSINARGVWEGNWQFNGRIGTGM